MLGAQVLVYGWESTPLNVTAPVFELPRLSQAKFTCATHDAIAHFAGNPNASATELAPCLVAATEQVPPAQRLTTPVYLRATAGMRVLQANNAPAAAAILSAITNLYRSLSVDYARSSAEILPGALEGLLGCLGAPFPPPFFPPGGGASAALDFFLFCPNKGSACVVWLALFAHSIVLFVFVFFPCFLPSRRFVFCSPQACSGGSAPIMHSARWKPTSASRLGRWIWAVRAHR